MSKAISKAVGQLLRIVQDLRRAHPKKKFTLDGRLVGDLGEALAEDIYDINVFEKLEKHHDARSRNGRLVQIKATMKNSLTFPADHIPDYYLGLRIDSKGTAKEIFNGPGRIAHEAIRNRRPTKNNLHSISLKRLEGLNKRVPPKERIPKRSNSRCS
ncbi:hypothetical protein N9903_01320 [bacterium]|nr:hypothetical protein [bacterium]